MRCELAPKSRPVRCALLCQNKTGHAEAVATFLYAHTHKLAVMPAPKPPFRAASFGRLGLCAQASRAASVYGLCIGFAVLS